jgi:hypothetical protein
MNYELLDAARNFSAKLTKVSDEDLNETYQRLATEANDSDYASDLEPKSGLVVAIQAELKRRAKFVKYEELDQPEPAEPFTNDDRVFGPEEI